MRCQDFSLGAENPAAPSHFHLQPQSRTIPTAATSSLDFTPRTPPPRLQPFHTHRSHGERTRRPRRPVSAYPTQPFLPSTLPPTSTRTLVAYARGRHSLTRRSFQLRPTQMQRNEPHHQSQRPRLSPDLARQSRRERPLHRREPGLRTVRLCARHGRERRCYQ